MGLVKQLPALLLRGSLANVTMKNLTEFQKQEVERVMTRVSSHPMIEQHKNGVISKFRNTIGNDYFDKSVAENEFQIAIWRATVELLYHQKYSFYCSACGSKTKRTNAGRIRLIDRQEIPCPSCNKVYVEDPGDTNLIIGYMDFDEFQNNYKNISQFAKAPKCSTTIKYHGTKKYSDEQIETILNDDTQLAKFFTEFIWNYFRQQIKENRWKEQRKIETITGSADKIIFLELANVCKDFNLEFTANTDHQYYSINLNGLKSPPEFSAIFANYLKKASDNKVSIRFCNKCIKILVDSSTNQISADISKLEQVVMLGEFGEDNAKDQFISQISFKTVKGVKMDLEDHVEKIDFSDTITAIRESLPDGPPRTIFDIYANVGKSYQEFLEKFGDVKPQKNHIAKFLGVTTKVVGQYIDNIRIQCLVHGLGPR